VASDGTDAFDRLKNILIDALVRRLPTAGLLFKVQIDASQAGFGPIL
jgi:hypothetical protein